MFLLLFIGAVSAIGHHFFYHDLNGKEGDAQSLMFRYGTIFAFCAKASFGTAVAMAFQQRAWLVVRRKTARLDTVDSIFTANTEITSLLDWRAIWRAKVSTCLALYCWLTPLVVIMTSETLSTVATGITDLTSCPSVRTLNFSNEETHNPRDRLKINHRYEMSLSMWYETAELGPEDDPTEDKFEYWAGPSEEYKMLFPSRVMSQGEPVTRKGAGLEICSENWNCSYTIDFVAPAYKCEELASGVGSKVKKLGDSEPPFNTSIIAPEGNFTYFGVTDQGEYGKQLPDSRDSGECSTAIWEVLRTFLRGERSPAWEWGLWRAKGRV
ncbi:hypothetical protein CEP51_004707 [Fusarium floridanum]|uniref:Uncharacterized protein n=1 Tax=Fusarium floridanum TaxID=1325733 RepID=A0A428RZZ8_9HYPO|nr:hypothetical protein CEP51_004707 [Fusarium floridanum]